MTTTDPVRTQGRFRRRPVLWIAGAVGVVFALLVAVFAIAGSPGTPEPLRGKPAPVLSGRLLVGRGSLALSQFAGKWVLVNFAASWCPPCHKELPQLFAFARTEQRYDAVIVTVNYQPSDAAGLAAWYRSAHVTWPAVAGSADTAVDWGVDQLPTTYIVNPAGVVAGVLTDGVNAAGVDRALAKAEAT